MDQGLPETLVKKIMVCWTLRLQQRSWRLWPGEWCDDANWHCGKVGKNQMLKALGKSGEMKIEMNLHRCSESCSLGRGRKINFSTFFQQIHHEFVTWIWEILGQTTDLWPLLKLGFGQPLSLVAVFRGRTSGNTVFPSQVEDGELFSVPLHFSGRGWFDTKNHWWIFGWVLRQAQDCVSRLSIVGKSAKIPGFNRNLYDKKQSDLLAIGKPKVINHLFFQDLVVL